MKCYPEIMFNRVKDEMNELENAYNRRHLGEINLQIRNLKSRLTDLQDEIAQLLEKYDIEPNNLIVPEEELFSK